MNTTKWLMPLFAVAVAAQIAVPASMLARHELTLRHGTAWKFRTAPVDPYDAFRGRYVALGFDQNEVPIAPGVKIQERQKAFAVLATGDDGFARLEQLAVEPPQGKPYLEVHVLWLGNSKATVALPFDRYFMEEHLAPAAERAYREMNRRSGAKPSYVVVRVREGRGVIEDLFVGGKPIRDCLRELGK